MNPNRSSKAAWLGWLAFVLLVAAIAVPRVSTLQAEIHEQPRPQAFLSGAERSEAVLKEIAETLRRIDGRLERLEKAIYADQPPGQEAQGPMTKAQ